MPLCAPLTDKLEPLPITPPEIPTAFDERTFKPDSRTIKKALHVLATERQALSHLEDLYSSSPDAQESLVRAVKQIILSETRHGKTILTGVGKSGHIAKKLVATFVSLGIHAVFLHPIEALHGDLGIVRPADTVIMITFSGRTPELLSLVQHIQSSIPLIIMTAHLSAATCPLLSHPVRHAATNILLPTTIHETETSSFGVSAPTTSTTITLALGDSLALAVADELHSSIGVETPAVFASNHPGGAIGANLRASIPDAPRMSELATNVSQVPLAQAPVDQQLLCFHVLLAAVKSPRGFVRTSPTHIIGPRRIQRIEDPSIPVSDVEDEFGRMTIERTDWISVLSSTTVEECKRWIHQMRNEGSGRGRDFLKRGTLLGIVDHNEVTGVVEIEEVMGEDFA
jgi:D-arabinose 5-phosphate isomerase GutQ